MPTIGELMAVSAEVLLKENIPSAQLDIEILLSNILKTSKIDLHLNHKKCLTDHEIFLFTRDLKRRAAHEPIAYITGKKEFWSLNFKVSPAVLIPRPETELLIETALNIFNKNNSIRILDLGTGSGNIAVSLAKEFPLGKITAIDKSRAALQIAGENAATNQVSEKIDFLSGSLFDPIQSLNQYDLIISNPPYIPTAEINELASDIKDYEPFSALDGKEDGLYFYRQIITAAPEYLKPGGVLIMEIGDKQGKDILKLFSLKKEYAKYQVEKDYGGTDRLVQAKVF